MPCSRHGGGALTTCDRERAVYDAAFVQAWFSEYENATDAEHIERCHRWALRTVEAWRIALKSQPD